MDESFMNVPHGSFSCIEMWSAFEMHALYEEGAI